ncbi:protein RALF-like 19 [Canna indica]|uniref:Protein RALF-like 19 n=1 Tax=Canna indica TaxID=4628 RepID=A0AAQ3KY42_9LILI|nr:protein RALF-like 19 [Canna indica]
MTKLNSSFTAKKKKKKKKKKRTTTFLLATLLLFLLTEKNTAREEEETVNAACNGRGRGCSILEEGEEMEMRSEESRRQLWDVLGKKYISYEALKRDVVPCTKPGVPYYNCHSLPRANPYRRGCQIISGCRGASP